MSGTISVLATASAGTGWFEIALIIFMVVFLAIVVWVLLTRGEYFRKASRIPLEDDKVVTPREQSTSTDDEDRKESNHGR